jgi:hypothetical protein
MVTAIIFAAILTATVVTISYFSWFYKPSEEEKALFQ